MGKVTSYLVKATPEDVLDFYKKIMSERGWPPASELDDGTLSFMYVASAGKTSPKTLYSVTIEAKSDGNRNGVTSVEVSTAP